MKQRFHLFELFTVCWQGDSIEGIVMTHETSVSGLNDVMGHDNTFKRIPLSADSEEFKKVETMFHKTILKHKAKITVIEKIKNAFLNERYKRYSKCMNKT